MSVRNVIGDIFDVDTNGNVRYNRYKGQLGDSFLKIYFLEGP